MWFTVISVPQTNASTGEIQILVVTWHLARIFLNDGPERNCYKNSPQIFPSHRQSKNSSRLTSSSFRAVRMTVQSYSGNQNKIHQNLPRFVCTTSCTNSRDFPSFQPILRLPSTLSIPQNSRTEWRIILRLPHSGAVQCAFHLIHSVTNLLLQFEFSCAVASKRTSWHSQSIYRPPPERQTKTSMHTVIP